MQNKKKSINAILYFIIIFPFLKPESFSRIPTLNSIFNLWKIIAFVLVIVVIIKHKKITKDLLYIVIFQGWFIISTIINKGDFSTVFNYIITLISLGCIVELSTNDKKKFIKVLLFCFEIIIYSNFISMILYPKGMYSTGTVLTGIATENWLLGFKNTMVSYFLPAFIVALMYKNFENKKIRSNILMLIIVISSLWCGSATTILGIGITLLLFLIPNIKKNTKLFNIENYFILSIILFFVIVIFRLQNIFEFLIVDILNKDLTFTNRTTLWDITLEYFMQRPIIGYGWQSSTIRHFMYNSQTIITAHNQILEYLYMGGLIGITLYLLLIKKIINNTKPFIDDENVQIISIGFLTMQILNIAEVFLNPLMHLVLILSVYAPKFTIWNKTLKKEKNEIEKETINYNTSL